MKFYSIKELQKLNKPIEVLNINSKTRQLYLILKLRRLKREFNETENQLMWEILKNGRQNFNNSIDWTVKSV